MFPQMYGLAYKISKIFPGVIPPDPHCGRDNCLPHPSTNSSFPTVERKSAPTLTGRPGGRPTSYFTEPPSSVSVTVARLLAALVDRIDDFLAFIA